MTQKAPFKWVSCKSALTPYELKHERNLSAIPCDKLLNKWDLKHCGRQFIF